VSSSGTPPRASQSNPDSIVNEPRLLTITSNEKKSGYRLRQVLRCFKRLFCVILGGSLLFESRTIERPNNRRRGSTRLDQKYELVTDSGVPRTTHSHQARGGYFAEVRLTSEVRLEILSRLNSNSFCAVPGLGWIAVAPVKDHRNLDIGMKTLVHRASQCSLFQSGPLRMIDRNR
jgi:hypothetical protein